MNNPGSQNVPTMMMLWDHASRHDHFCDNRVFLMVFTD